MLLGDLFKVDLVNNLLDFGVELLHTLFVDECTLVQHLLQLASLHCLVSHVIDLGNDFIGNVAQVLDVAKNTENLGGLHFLLHDLTDQFLLLSAVLDLGELLGTAV